MNENESPAVDPHADKYNDPRVVVTRTQVLALVAIFVVGAIAAVVSIYARKTKLEKTTKFWGPDVITAIQLGDHVELIPGPGADFSQVELTAFPGLGHLRKALLEENHYQWATVEDFSVEALADVPATEDFAGEANEQPMVVRLEFSDPHYKRVPPALIDVELISGTVGPADGSQRVKVTDRVRPALRHQLGLLMKVSEMRYSQRNHAANEEAATTE
ncbi:hypothetical protein [Rhodopirellula bahusiensis]|uniref:Transmembrane protein n=1 Tax=Rhodopirellula bahusiensis TaxID=2014065 RepID=A0A2G1WBZ0_9BACT|nr:hypothetical protein [Rhodopirellula bahusiensis]PHQ36554.1 hypothetical protein CEE69_04040 [Rhodopirellula bahusiensis]